MGMARTVASVFGAIYVLIGILGFVPPLVTGSAPAGMESASGNLLGIFPINAVHSVVHLVIGAALLYGTTATATAIMVMKMVGAACILVGVLGLVDPNGLVLLPLGGADILLHLATGAILLGVAFMSPADVDDVRAT